MKLYLRELFEAENITRQLECEVGFEGVKLPTGISLKKPAALTGSVYNKTGIVKLDFHVTAELELVCDRCLDKFERTIEYDFSHILVRSLNHESDDDEYIVCENDSLELDDLAVGDVLLELPTKLLCREDCLGLCPKCGENLNHGLCECQKAE